MIVIVSHNLVLVRIVVTTTVVRFLMVSALVAVTMPFGLVCTSTALAHNLCRMHVSSAHAETWLPLEYSDRSCSNWNG